MRQRAAEEEEHERLASCMRAIEAAGSICELADAWWCAEAEVERKKRAEEEEQEERDKRAVEALVWGIKTIEAAVMRVDEEWRPRTECEWTVWLAQEFEKAAWREEFEAHRAETGI